ncbi:hypothetical protein AGOR_G00199530 [Albula goreensis]|uniref:Paralemmin-3 n=1 Tax=Albula goreensis TaxID=1534307 RepID=A0A8T3CNR7_9TELE|nr:hypothetical protein AGOR_G00199530 [Albula goreensis]
MAATTHLHECFSLTAFESSWTELHRVRSKMDEAEKYQQRLQAIAEKRRLQEEQDRARREMEDKKLRVQQLKRKSLRDQWLMEGPPTTPDSPGPSSPFWGSPTQEVQAQIDKLQMESQQIAENLQDHGNNKTEELKEDGGSSEHPSAALENGQQEQSVLGVVEVQVEQDVKTGATTIMSASSLPSVSLGEAVDLRETVLEDGLSTAQAAEGGGAESTPQELGQNLAAEAESGVGAVPEEAAAIPNGTQEGEDETQKPFAEDKDADADSTLNPPQQEDLAGTLQSESVSPGQGEGGLEGVGPATQLVEDPVLLLASSEAEPGQDVGEEDAGEIMRAERVLVTDEGDEVAEAGEEKEQPPDSPTDLTPSPDGSAPVETPALEAPEPVPEDGAEASQETEKVTEAQAPEDEAAAAETGMGTGEGETEGPGENEEAAPVSEEPPAVTEMDVLASQVPVYCTVQPVIVPQPDTGGAGEAESARPEEKPEEKEEEVVEAPAPAAAEGQFQDVPLDGNAKPEVGEKPELQPLMGSTETPAELSEQQTLLSPKTDALNEDAAPSRAEGTERPKTKSCQCCSVM